MDLSCMANRSVAANTDILADQLEDEIVCFGVASFVLAPRTLASPSLTEFPRSLGSLHPVRTRHRQAY